MPIKNYLLILAVVLIFIAVVNYIEINGLKFDLLPDSENTAVSEGSLVPYIPFFSVLIMIIIIAKLFFNRNKK